MAVPDLQDAISHLQQKNPDAAITVLEAKIDELPAHLTAHVLLARAYEAKQRWADALASWENVRFLMPNSPVAREGKARVLRRLRQGDDTPPASAPSDAAPASADDTDTPTAAPATAPDDTPDASSPETPDAETPDTETPDAEPTDTEPVDTETPDTPPSDAKPTADDDGETPPEAPRSDAAPEDDAPDEPAPDSPEASDESASPSDPSPGKAQPTTATEAVSELEQLRRQAEEEARQGGARGDLSEADVSDPDPEPDDASPAPDTPEERVREMNEDDDLERLIDELESARIEPNPDVEEVPTPDLDDNVDDIVSETLARIHEAQDQYRKAAQIYVKLASQEPDEARTYLQKASEMREKAEAQQESESTDS